MNEVEELCNRVAIIRSGRIVYEGRLDELRATAAGTYALRTSDDELAEQICAGHRGIHDLRVSHDGLRMRGDERAIEALSLELAAAGVALRALVPDAASLEERFFALTEDPLPAPGTRTRARARTGEGGLMPHTLTVYRWELRKLVAQKRTYLGLAAAIIAPTIFVVALAVQNGAPNDVPFGRYVRDSGLAAPLVLLTFGSIWLFPLIASLVAGDIVASEDGNGTLKTILTRSVTRGQIFAAKAAAAASYALLALDRDGGRVTHGGHHVLGLQPDHEPLRHERLGLARARARVREPRRLRAATARDHRHRRVALDRHAQLRGSRRRCAHDGAPDAADRHPARASAASSPTSSRRSSTPGTDFCAHRSTGRRSRAAAGSR